MSGFRARNLEGFNREEANTFLKRYLPRYNAQFGVAPKESKAVFRKKPLRPVLKRILCLKETRTVKQDHTISFEGLTLPIPPSSKWVSIAKQKVEVIQFQEGSLEVRYKQQTVLCLSKENLQGLMEKYQIKKRPLQNAA